MHNLKSRFLEVQLVNLENISTRQNFWAAENGWEQSCRNV